MEPNNLETPTEEPTPTKITWLQKRLLKRIIKKAKKKLEEDKKKIEYTKKDREKLEKTILELSQHFDIEHGGITIDEHSIKLLNEKDMIEIIEEANKMLEELT